MDERYLRQLLIDEIGPEGQKALLSSHVLVIGAGGLGSPVLLYLAAAGVGRITIVDHDVVSLSNLNRQVLYSEADLGVPKAMAAAKRLSALNSTIVIRPVVAAFSDDNAEELLAGIDLVVDCVDSSSARYTVNQACVARNIPLVEAGINGLDGYVYPIIPHKTACFACGNPQRKPASTGPIAALGATAGVIGSIQAGIALRMLCDLSVPAGERFVFSLSDLSCFQIPINRDPKCPVCKQ